MKTKSIFLSKCHKHFKHVFFSSSHSASIFFCRFSIVLLYITSVRIRFWDPWDILIIIFPRQALFYIYIIYQRCSYSCWPTPASSASATCARYFTYDWILTCMIVFCIFSHFGRYVRSLISFLHHLIIPYRIQS